MRKLHRCTHKYIRTYTGERYQILGSVTLPVSRRGKQTKLTLKADQENIQAILEMPEPSDITALKRFLGMINYLSKYLVRLST